MSVSPFDPMEVVVDTTTTTLEVVESADTVVTVAPVNTTLTILENVDVDPEPEETTVVVELPPVVHVVQTPAPPSTLVEVTEEAIALVQIGGVGPPGPQGPQGPPGDAAVQTYEHDQAVPSTEWTINHNLGFRPNVQAFDTLGREIEGDIVHTSINQTVLTFSVLVSGSAYLS